MAKKYPHAKNMDAFDLEAEAQGAAIRRTLKLGSQPMNKGKRTMGAKMNYRKTMPATVAIRARRVG